MTGVGPFKHDDPGDRPSGLFDGQVTIHLGEGRENYVLVPVIPPRPAAGRGGSFGGSE
jgi:hypothetical protein